MRLQEETTLRYHSELNPKLWDNGKLKDDVLEALRKIANAYPAPPQ